MSLVEKILKEAQILPSERHLTFYHGGKLDNIESERKYSKNNTMYGPGLYLTSNYNVVEKYAKGNRKKYLVTVQKGNDLSDAILELTKVFSFVDRYVIGRLRKEIKSSFQKQSRDGKIISASVFHAILLNNEAVKVSDYNNLLKFLVYNNIDYELINNQFGWGDTTMCLYNTNLIVDSEQIKPGDEIIYQDLITKKKF